MTEALFFDFTQLFDVDEYLYFMEDSLREEDAPRQIDFLERVMQMTPEMRVLDLGCGHGRHANELASRGYNVVGIDLVEGFLERARADAKERGLGTVEFLRGDIGTFESPAMFDRAVCLFDAFGFFDDGHGIATLRNAHRALKDGGMLALDLRTREWMVRLPSVSVLDKGNGDMMIDRHHFDITTGRFVDRRTYLRNGKQRVVMFSVRLYAFTEIRLILESIGFTVDAAFGGYDGSPLGLDKNRTLIIAKKNPTLEALLGAGS
ncbi:MAG: class I SAM-dependent methyltransferase [Polyangiaceae bacterium]